MLQRLGFGPEVFSELLATVASEGVLAQAGVGDHACQLLREAHADTWFTTQGLAQPSSCAIGSRTGDPLGDLIYNSLAAQVNGEIAKEMEQRGLAPMLPPPAAEFWNYAGNDPVPCTDDTCVDDGMFS